MTEQKNEELEVHPVFLAANVPIVDLLDAINKHGDALIEWMNTAPKNYTYKNIQEARFADFTPMETWRAIWDIVVAAEKRAQEAMKAAMEGEAN